MLSYTWKGGETMNTGMSDRISELIYALGLKKIQFATQLNIDPAYVTQLTKGKRAPSDRLIADICRVFHVREEWLRTGEGEMFLPQLDTVDKICNDLGLGEMERETLKLYLKLDPIMREQFATNVFRVVNETFSKSAKSPVSSEVDIATELAELKRQNKEILAQNRELSERLEAIEKEDAILEAAASSSQSCEAGSRLGTGTEMTLEEEADEFAAMAREQFLSEKQRVLQAPSANESVVG